MMRCLFTDLISPTSAAPPGKPFPSSFCFCYTQNITHCTYCTMYSINLDDEQTYPSIVHLKIFGLLNDNLYPSFLLSDSTCFWKSCHSSSLRGWLANWQIIQRRPKICIAAQRGSVSPRPALVLINRISRKIQYGICTVCIYEVVILW